MTANHKTYLATDNLAIGYSGKGGVHKFLQKDLNEKLIEGEFICLLGPNGCGKSTLIRTLAGIQSPVSGKIFFEGKEIQELSNEERSNLLSVVLTDNSAVGNITVSEIVALGRYNYTNWMGTLSSHDKQKINESLENVSLGEFKSRKFSTLSDGEKQRAFIAKGLASDAPVMLLDEPTAHLDISNKVSIMTLLRQLTRISHRSVLVASHELDLALKLADEIWLMLPDQTIYKGTPEELISSGNLDEVFGNEFLQFNSLTGNFAMNTIPIGSVVLEGSGKYLDITKQALNRIGFTTKALKNKITYNIVVEGKHWKVSIGEKNTESDSLAETCRLLRMADK